MKLLAHCLLLLLLGFPGAAAPTPGWPEALRLADFILSLQTPAGAIEDAPGSNTVNTDSNMEYALFALAAAYQHSGRAAYLEGLERGIAWLAEREERADPRFRGSWWYGYDREGRHVATVPGPGFLDARGVDTTSALFVYLLYLDRRVNPASTLPDQYRPQAMAALEFLERECTDSDGLTWSSWIQAGDGAWRRWDYKYSADQGDVWLGLRAAALLYDPDRFGPRAEALRQRVRTAFFARARGRYPLGMDSQGVLDWRVKNFDPVQAQGFLPWAWGASAADRAAVAWLRSRQRQDGSLRVCAGDPGYSLSAAMLALGEAGLGAARLGAARLGQPAPQAALRWLCSPAIRDAASGGVYDSLKARDLFCNNAGLCAIALAGWPAFADGD